VGTVARGVPVTPVCTRCQKRASADGRGLRCVIGMVLRSSAAAVAVGDDGGGGAVGEDALTAAAAAADAGAAMPLAEPARGARTAGGDAGGEPAGEPGRGDTTRGLRGLRGLVRGLAAPRGERGRTAASLANEPAGSGTVSGGGGPPARARPAAAAAACSTESSETVARGSPAGARAPLSLGSNGVAGSSGGDDIEARPATRSVHLMNAAAAWWPCC